MLEIELTESLRRRRDELKDKVETAGDSIDHVSEGGDVEARKKELKGLQRTIKDLTARASGEDSAYLLVIRSLIP